MPNRSVTTESATLHYLPQSFAAACVLFQQRVGTPPSLRFHLNLSHLSILSHRAKRSTWYVVRGMGGERGGGDLQ